MHAPKTTEFSSLFGKVKRAGAIGRVMLATNLGTMIICEKERWPGHQVIVTDSDRMFADVDHSHPAVRNDIFEWGSWITSSLNLGGMRLDAIKHYSLSFLRDFIAHMDTQHPNQFYVGEYWDAKTEVLEKVIRKFHGRLNLFDVQLVYTFSDYSKGRKIDLRAILDGSLVQSDPAHAVVSPF